MEQRKAKHILQWSILSFPIGQGVLPEAACFITEAGIRAQLLALIGGQKCIYRRQEVTLLRFYRGTWLDVCETLSMNKTWFSAMTPHW